MEFDQSIVSKIMAIDADQALAYDAIAMQIWEHPEVSFEEEKSAALYMERLAKSRFCHHRISRNGTFVYGRVWRW